MFGRRPGPGFGPGFRPLRGLALLALSAAASLSANAAAQAGCERRIVNRSGFLVTVSQDGGPAVVVPPGRGLPLRYRAGATPVTGKIDVTAACPGAAQPAFSDSYETTAVLDRCYIGIGDGFFEPQLGKAFSTSADTKPLAVNVPRQGDIVVGPAGLSCPPPPRISARY